MKVLLACEILDQVAAATKAVRANARATSITRCSKALRRFQGRDLVEVSAKTAIGRVPVAGSTGEMSEICSSLAGASAFMRALGDDARAIEINELERTLAESSGAMIRDYIAALESAFDLGAPVPEPDENVVEMYVRLLKSATHDVAEFRKVFDHLESDNRLARPEIVAVASAFAFRMAKSTTRKEALERIWSIHSASASMDAKSRAMKGKSAA